MGHQKMKLFVLSTINKHKINTELEDICELNN